MGCGASAALANVQKEGRNRLMNLDIQEKYGYADFQNRWATASANKAIETDFLNYALEVALSGVWGSDLPNVQGLTELVKQHLGKGIEDEHRFSLMDINCNVENKLEGILSENHKFHLKYKYFRVNNAPVKLGARPELPKAIRTEAITLQIQVKMDSYVDFAVHGDCGREIIAFRRLPNNAANIKPPVGTVAASTPVRAFKTSARFNNMKVLEIDQARSAWSTETVVVGSAKNLLYLEVKNKWRFEVKESAQNAMDVFYFNEGEGFKLVCRFEDGKWVQNNKYVEMCQNICANVARDAEIGSHTTDNPIFMALFEKAGER